MAYKENLGITSCEAISDAFLKLHKIDGFETLPPSSLLHESVPMSFVMSAGLIQVENDLEQIVEKTGGKFAFTQPCFRHFDVRQVGLDTTHLSLFHMSAAFHIGCSERKTMLPRLWHFLTEILKLEKKRLWITYLDDEEFGRDQRTYECWLDVGVDKTHLLGLGQSYCFWRQRSTGQIASDGKKCGPHTEVFIERDGPECGEYCGIGNPGECRCGRFVEISNSLFIENYVSDENKLAPAGTVFSECVIGIERLAMVLQDVKDVQHVDRFDEWRSQLEKHLTVIDHTKEREASVNIILDHLIAFIRLCEDGAPEPGRGGRRAIMRKVARGAMTEMLLLGLSPFQILSGFDSSIYQATNSLREEFKRYNKTLLKGYQKIRQSDPAKPLIDLAIELDELYGVPLVLTKNYYNKIITDGFSSHYLHSKDTDHRSMNG